MTNAAPTMPADTATPRIAAATWVKLAIVAVAALQFAQVFTRSINWDEFGHYNHIVQLHAGTLPQVLQRFHAFAYSWVTALPGSPIDHIIVIRLFMFACEMVALAAIVGIAARFAERTPALLCGLAYISFSYVFQHGASFRYDPPLTAALMGLLWLFLSARLDAKVIVGAGLLVALLPLISIKAVLYAPAFAGVAYLRWADDGFTSQTPLRLAVIGAVALAAFAALFALLSQWIAGPAGAEDTATTSRAAGAVFTFFDNPNWSRILRAATTNPLVTLVVAAFPFVIAKAERRPAEKLALGGLFTVALTPIIYVNTAPYYFVFMLAPVLAACGPVMSAALTRLSAPLIAAILCASTVVTLITEEPSPLDQQRALHEVTIATFGDEVRYFDFPGFLGTRGKANPFMSPLTVMIHDNAGLTMIEPAMQAEPVPLVIENNFILTSVLTDREDVWLAPEDRAALQGNYVRFWGPLWIAGRHVPAGSTVIYKNLVPGAFTVTGAGMSIDGELVRAGDTVQLGRGTYVLEGWQADSRIIWGDNIAPPSASPPEGPIWVQF
ncbi:hypothetical protein [Aurantiacibacter sp. D1-12]|uniref:hypothetical protein n=1 Tax=Aurantiacibacter sp. D1-12 TaxID=2993658 RepID=UPI00237C5605|nr:hypothetical protein [Aurantiacibacter sp. D1-12]MDE1466339.1 hypothetical protein [Aurantiacibacter sp. D1-12]